MGTDNNDSWSSISDQRYAAGRTGLEPEGHAIGASRRVEEGWCAARWPATALCRQAQAQNVQEETFLALPSVRQPDQLRRGRAESAGR